MYKKGWIFSFEIIGLAVSMSRMSDVVIFKVLDI